MTNEVVAGVDDQSSTGADADTAPEPAAAKPARRRLRPGAVLTTASVLVVTIGGAVTLLFQVYHPSWEPCVGSSGASFTGAPVFPETAGEFNAIPLNKTFAASSTRGVDVRATYRSDNIPGANLWLYYSVVTVGAGGTVDGIVNGLDERAFDSQEQHGCSDSGGFEFFVYPDKPTMPALQPGRPYRIVLELYRGPREQYGTNRLALAETPVFYEPRRAASSEAPP